MRSWVVVPCLLTLHDEFNTVSPKRDKGADGTIGDSAHTSASDHTPDEDSDILRDRDSDHVNEVHALDIDSSGPWPGGLAWFDRTIKAIVAREKADYESPTAVGRLQYVIWNGRIASRSWGWTWRDYAGADQHTNHAHFSARYVTAAEASTRPWGVAPVPAPPAPHLPTNNQGQDGIEDMTKDEIKAIVLDALGDWTEENPDSTTVPKEKARVGGWVRMANQRERERFDGVNAKLDALLAEVANVDEAVAATVFAGTDEQLIPVLREALGAERLRALAAKVLAAG